ncbi:hypothetical protein FACS189449_08860 [Alphaproteobacteria bacterium]|nr:hypothetical protein FACS189449_08860 [Alphaproteobacteria bacterium]
MKSIIFSAITFVVFTMFSESNAMEIDSSFIKANAKNGVFTLKTDKPVVLKGVINLPDVALCIEAQKFICEQDLIVKKLDLNISYFFVNLRRVSAVGGGITCKVGAYFANGNVISATDNVLINIGNPEISYPTGKIKGYQGIALGGKIAEAIIPDPELRKKSLGRATFKRGDFVNFGVGIVESINGNVSIYSSEIGDIYSAKIDGSSDLRGKIIAYADRSGNRSTNSGEMALPPYDPLKILED